MIKMLFLKTEFICILCFLSMPMNAQHVEYDKVDSITKDFLNKIRCYESELNDGSFSYIPKRMLNNQNLLDFIKSGDIIAIVTRKKGLDIAHVGFAIWINEKFHLLHASSLKKKVVLDTKTLFDYSLENRSNLGIRVFRLCE